MPKASDFVETEATSGEVPQTPDEAVPARNSVDTPAPRTASCPLCSKQVGKVSVPARIPVLMPDGMWHHIFRPAHPYCAFMYEKGV